MADAEGAVGSADAVSVAKGNAEGALHPSPLPNPPPQGGRGLLVGAAVDWAEVRRAYELSNETVTSIRTRFGIAKSTLERRRVAEGWTTRPTVAIPRGPNGRKIVGIDLLELRLNKLVITCMAMLDDKLKKEGLTLENARLATEMCRAEELRMRTTRQKTARSREMKKHDATSDFRDDPAWLDAELRRRLAKLTGGRGD
jgi:hypothetical protein